MTREFVEQENSPYPRQDRWSRAGIDASAAGKSRWTGHIGFAIPEEYGGFNKDFYTVTVATEMTGMGHAFSVAYGAHTGIGTLPILYLEPKHKTKYLPGLASGKIKSELLFNREAEVMRWLQNKSGIKPRRHALYSRRKKMWITNAGFADLFIVFAKIDGKDFTDLSSTEIRPGWPSVKRKRKMGIKGSSTCRVFRRNEIAEKKISSARSEKDISSHLISWILADINYVSVFWVAAKAWSIFRWNMPTSACRLICRYRNWAIKYKLSEQAIPHLCRAQCNLSRLRLYRKERKELLANGIAREKHCWAPLKNMPLNVPC